MPASHRARAIQQLPKHPALARSEEKCQSCEDSQSGTHSESFQSCENPASHTGLYNELRNKGLLLELNFYICGECIILNLPVSMTCEEDWKSIRVVSEVLSLKKHALAYIRAETFIKKVNHRWNHMLISCEDFVSPAEYTRRPYIRL